MTVYNSVVTAISVATTRIRDDEEESNGMKKLRKERTKDIRTEMS